MRTQPSPGSKPFRTPALKSGLRRASLALGLWLFGTYPAWSDSAIPVPNATFEDGPGNLASSWTIWGGGEGTRALAVDTRAHAGRRSGYLEDRSGKNSIGWESAPIPVDSGQTYRFSAYTLILSGTLELYLQFFDAGGKRIGVKTAKCPVGEGWRVNRVQDRAPDGSQTCRLLFYSSAAGTVEAWCDDAALETVAQVVPSPQPLAPAGRTLYPLKYREHPRVFYTVADQQRFREQG